MELRTWLIVTMLVTLVGGHAESGKASDDGKKLTGETHGVQHAPEYLSPAERVYLSCVKEGAETAECERRTRPFIEMEQRQAEQRREEREKRWQLEREREEQARELERRAEELKRQAEKLERHAEEEAKQHELEEERQLALEQQRQERQEIEDMLLVLRLLNEVRRLRGEERPQVHIYNQNRSTCFNMGSRIFCN